MEELNSIIEILSSSDEMKNFRMKEHFSKNEMDDLINELMKRQPGDLLQLPQKQKDELHHLLVTMLNFNSSCPNNDCLSPKEQCHLDNIVNTIQKNT